MVWCDKPNGIGFKIRNWLICFSRSNRRKNINFDYDFINVCFWLCYSFCNWLASFLRCISCDTRINYFWRCLHDDYCIKRLVWIKKLFQSRRKSWTGYFINQNCQTIEWRRILKLKLYINSIRSRKFCMQICYLFRLGIRKYIFSDARLLFFRILVRSEMCDGFWRVSIRCLRAKIHCWRCPSHFHGYLNGRI